MPDQMMSSTSIADVLIDLAKTARDSQEGYKTAANDTSDPQLKSMFLGLAHTRGEQGDELDRLIQRAGGQPPSRGGDVSGALHRMFLDLKTRLSGNDRLAVLEEVVRGESYAEATYDKGLRQDLPADMRQVVQRQHDSIRQSRDKFRQMKTAAGGSAGESSTFGGVDLAGIGDKIAQTGRESLDRLAQGGRDSYDRLAKSGRQSQEWVSGYVTERPVMSTVVALGLGFLIGALTMVGARSGPRSERDRARSDRYGYGDRERDETVHPEGGYARGSVDDSYRGTGASR